MNQGNELELLAPAGKWEVLTSVAEAGADAVYAGGKRFNMRGLRPDMNFTEKEIESAVEYLHGIDKKLYITLNNLYYDYELDELKDYMGFLAAAGVDALIVQDMSVARICSELKLNIPLHASVQVGVSNLPAVKYLEEKGFTRVILSKNTSGEDIKTIKSATSMGIEFFAHGDLCVSHTGQCYMSSFLAAEGGNRGKCIKPCRWEYSLHSSIGAIQQGYLLANNDLCLYPYLSDLISAGVTSFKIEGRMRTPEYLAHLIKIYRKALDKILEEPSSYVVDDQEMQILKENRIRDFCSGNLFGRPGRESIDISGEREPFFISRSFLIRKDDREDYPTGLKTAGSIKEISVKAGSLKALEAICDIGVDNVILDCESMRHPLSGWTAPKINTALELTSNSNIKLVLESPRILNNKDARDFKRTMEGVDQAGIHAVIANDFGSIKIAKDMGFRLWGGYGLNVCNSTAGRFYHEQGLQRLALSQEMKFSNLRLVKEYGADFQITVHGPLCGMISDHCIIRAGHVYEDECQAWCTRDDYVLKDIEGQLYKVRADLKCRNYVYYPHQICLLPYLPLLSSAGIKHIRIDGQYYDANTISEVTAIYIEAVRGFNVGKWEQEKSYHRLLNMFPGGLTSSPAFARVKGVEE
ncbi:peptidase u32 [hydrocarbon metagenome]|uniref:Peptidase u32 n=1 Tax=hydrocarbon metagenome TaxID=938273 RepID=A0A0W8E2Z3_9ZZZZ